MERVHVGVGIHQRYIKYTLSVGIAVIRDKIATIGYTPVFAALTVSAMVFVIIYLFAQKTFVRSITAGAVKG
mgnify:CR=1 FL=1